MLRDASRASLLVNLEEDCLRRPLDQSRGTRVGCPLPLPPWSEQCEEEVIVVIVNDDVMTTAMMVSLQHFSAAGPSTQPLPFLKVEFRKLELSFFLAFTVSFHCHSWDAFLSSVKTRRNERPHAHLTQTNCVCSNNRAVQPMVQRRATLQATKDQPDPRVQSSQKQGEEGLAEF